MKYTITWSERIPFSLEVEANSEEDALNMFRMGLFNNDFVKQESSSGPIEKDSIEAQKVDDDDLEC